MVRQGKCESSMSIICQTAPAVQIALRDHMCTIARIAVLYSASKSRRYSALCTVPVQQAAALHACIPSRVSAMSVHHSCRLAISQRPLPFNVSVVSDFMRSRDRFWKDAYPDMPFTQVARALEEEVWPLLLRCPCSSSYCIGSECIAGRPDFACSLTYHCCSLMSPAIQLRPPVVQGWVVLQNMRHGAMVTDCPRLQEDVRRAEDSFRRRQRSPPPLMRRR